VQDPRRGPSLGGRRRADSERILGKAAGDEQVIERKRRDAQARALLAERQDARDARLDRRLAARRRSGFIRVRAALATLTRNNWLIADQTVGELQNAVPARLEA